MKKYGTLLVLGSIFVTQMSIAMTGRDSFFGELQDIIDLRSGTEKLLDAEKKDKKNEEEIANKIKETQSVSAVVEGTFVASTESLQPAQNLPTKKKLIDEVMRAASGACAAELIDNADIQRIQQVSVAKSLAVEQPLAQRNSEAIQAPLGASAALITPIPGLPLPVLT